MAANRFLAQARRAFKSERDEPETSRVRLTRGELDGGWTAETDDGYAAHGDTPQEALANLSEIWDEPDPIR